jgi:hypothetical protein
MHFACLQCFDIPLFEFPMRFLSAASAAALLIIPSVSAAQSAVTGSMPLAPAHQFSIDLSLVGVSLGYAVRNSPNTSFGASIGIGGNWYNYMALAGRHFSEANGLSYESKDGSADKSLYELLRASVFVRREFGEGRQLDLGVKASGFLHSDSSDDDPGGGIFVGLDAKAMWWKWNRFRVGSELDAGMYTEGRPEFGVNVAPVLVRVTFP